MAAALREKGYGPSRLIVLARLGGPHEERRDGTAEGWDDASCYDLNTIAVECSPEKGALVLPRVSGLPDSAFLNDGQLTKRVVRSATLAALAPLPGAFLWDVGAGSGAISIEWLRAEPTSQAVAVERDPVRAGRVVENAEALGVPRLEVITGEAPQALAGLVSPDAVFVGGTGRQIQQIVEKAFTRLRVGGRLVASVASPENLCAVMETLKQAGADANCWMIQVSRGNPQLVDIRFETMNPHYLISATRET